jgi:hypothetical protein
MARRTHQGERRFPGLEGLFGRKDGSSGGQEGDLVCFGPHVRVGVHEALAEVLQRIDVFRRVHFFEKGPRHGFRRQHIVPQVLGLQARNDRVKPLGAFGMAYGLAVLVVALVMDDGHRSPKVNRAVQN